MGVPGMAGFGRLDRIHRKRADRVDRQLNHFVIRHKDSFRCVLSLLVLQRRHLAQPTQVSRSLAEFRSEKCLDQVPGQFRAFDASAQTKHVEVVVLDPLSCREMILNQTGADAFDFVQANRGAHAAATNRHATVHFAGSNGLTQRNDEIGIIIFRRQLVSAEISYLMARISQSGSQLFLQLKPTVISRNSYPHISSFICYSFFPAAARSART